MLGELRFEKRLRQAFCSIGFLIVLAFTVRTAFVCYFFLSVGQRVIRENLPFGYEAGAVAAAIASGKGFSSPLRMVQTGPTAWFTPIYPYLVAGIFKIWGIYSDASRLVIMTLNCAFAALTVIPIYGIAEKTFRKSVAVGAAWTWVFLPTSLFFPLTWIWDTTLAALFLALIFWATLAIRDVKTILPW